MAPSGQLTIVPVLLVVVVTFFGLIVVLVPNNSFCIVPLLRSVIDIIPCISVNFYHIFKCYKQKVKNTIRSIFYAVREFYVRLL